MLLPYSNFTLRIVKFSLDILMSYLDVLLCILEYVLYVNPNFRVHNK